MTCNAVTSVLSQYPGPSQVLLIIDHNPDLAEVASGEFSDANVTVLESTGDPGLSGARNTGLYAATQPITAFLDDDAIARPGWLVSLVEPYDDPSVVATGGGVVPMWSGSRPSWLPPEFDWVVGCSYVGLPEAGGIVRNPIGANMSVRTQHACDMGGFNATVGRVGTKPQGCEETELAIRMTTAVKGAKILYVPQAAVDHHVGLERATVGYFLRRCWHEGKSKAVVVQLVGASPGLERERRQAAVVIPASLLRELRRLLAGDVTSGQRMLASIAGLSATVSGYSTARFLRRRPNAPASLPA